MLSHEQATEKLDNLKRSIAAKCLDFPIAHLTMIGLFMSERGLESFLFKLIHPYYENSTACELGDLEFADVLEIVKGLPGAIPQSVSSETVTVIPDVPTAAGSPETPDIPKGLFRIHESFEDVANQTTDSEKGKQQCIAVRQRNGEQFMADFCDCEEVVSNFPFSTYYLQLTKLSVWFAAQYSTVPYEMLPPESWNNGSKKIRMLVKHSQ